MAYEQRKIEFLSPSSIKTFEDSVEDFAVKYLLKNRPPRMPQTQPMSVGSAFDAYAKSHLFKNLFGHYGPSDTYRLENIFEAQVEPHNREWALKAGKDCFDKYKASGALADLMLDLQRAVGPPRFEFSVQDMINWNGFNVPLLGKPDIYFMNEQGIRVVYDWKVNGYCSKSNTSPMKGYVCARDVNRGTRTQHKDCVIGSFKGININVMMNLEDGNKEWADQLSIYSWLLGEPIGSENVVFGIDQITGPGCSRITSHRLRVKPEYRFNLMDRICQIWEIVSSGHVFREMTREENDEHLALLEKMHQGSEVDDILS